MTEEEILLVKKTWKLFRSMDPALVADTFYSKLFADSPHLRKLFPKQMDQQYGKLMDMINIIVGRLDKFEKIEDEITAMGQRHVRYGARPIHYKLVGEALLWTLQQGLGPDWNEEIKNAWTTCYISVMNAMLAVNVK